MKENVRKCLKCGLSPAEDPNISLHRFPKPGRSNSLRCELWAKYCFPNDSWSSPQFQNKLYSKHLMLCTRHFKTSSFIDNSGKRLFKSAVPDEECDKQDPVSMEIEPQAGPSYIRDITSTATILQDSPESTVAKRKRSQPPATPSTSGVSTSKCHDQPSSPTDVANTMRCYVPLCINGFNTSGNSRGISFFKFPKDPNIRKEWVHAMGIKDWRPNSSYTICSEHFKEESFYETLHGRMMLYPDAVPIKNLDLDAPAALMVCRICLTVDSNMQQIGTFSEMFHRVTGLLASDSESCGLPQLLCWECAARLEAADTFRQKALRSDEILQDLMKPDTFISIRDIKAINRRSYGLKTSLVQKLIDAEHYDVKIHDNFIDTDHIKTEFELDVAIPEIFENEVINNIKENNSVPCNKCTKTNIHTNIYKVQEKKPEKFGNCTSIEDISNIYQSNNNIKTVSRNEESNTKYVMLQNNDEGSNVKFNVLQNSDNRSDAQYAILKNGDEGNNLKYMKAQNGDKENNLKYMMQNVILYCKNDNWNIKTEEPTIQNNEVVTEEIDDENLYEEYLYSDDDINEIVVETDNPEEISKTTHEENLEELDNVKNATQNKTVVKVRKILDNSRAVTGTIKEPCLKPSSEPVYENIFKITALSREAVIQEVLNREHSSKYKQARFKCTVCFRGFPCHDVKKRHMIKHSEESGPIKCEVCKIRFKKKQHLRNHMKVHSEEYSCQLCPFVTRTRTTALMHMKFHAGSIYKCTQCDLEFKKRSTLLSHQRLKHISDCVCELCGYTFLSTNGVRTHKMLQHKHIDKNVELEGPFCELCDVKFLSQNAYDKHLRLSSKHIESENDPLRLRNDSTRQVRQKPYQRRVKSVLHRDENTVTMQKEPVTCEQCGVELKSFQAYAVHFKSVHPGLNRTKFAPNKVPCICEHCGKIFANVHFLSGHIMLYHIGEKRYQCDHCDKVFCMKSSLVTHMIVHMETRPSFECHVCGKLFAFANNLRRHMFLHTGLKPFKCDPCDKAFATLGEHRSHVDHVHLKKPRPKRVRRRVKKVDISSLEEY